MVPAATMPPKIVSQPRQVPRTVCIYHANCLDGLGAAAVVRRLHPDCALMPMQYTDPPPPSLLGAKVYMVDFGLPTDAMRAIRAQAEEFTWIDHHASALPVWKTIGFGHLDVAECGTSLTWKVLFPDRPAPPVIAYIRDKDLWRWELPDSRAIAAGLWASFQGKPPDGILEADLVAMARLGAPIIEKIRIRVVADAAQGIPVPDPFGLKGRRALVVFTRRDLNEIADHILTPAASGGLGYDLAIMCYRKSANGRWVHSLRSVDADCGAIAAARGGGGHLQSACYLSDTPLIPPPAPPATGPARSEPGPAARI